jgi:hypothetical protein
MRVFMLIIVLMLAACQPRQDVPNGDDCQATGAPVPAACAPPVGHPDRCATEDGNDGAGRPCWWVDPHDGRVWYRP